jgi:hypothetical protein
VSRKSEGGFVCLGHLGSLLLSLRRRRRDLR